VNTAWTIDVLVERLTDPDPYVRIQAATLLGGLGAEARPAVPVLIVLLSEGDIEDRRLAALTLGEIGPAAEDALDALWDAVDDTDEGVVALALDALERIAQDDDDSWSEAA
jgi:HEAT repeat protein